MACRRHDRARLIGCHVGAVAIRGCTRGCCPYPREESYQEIITNERYTFGRAGYYDGILYYGGEENQSWKGRRPCINPYRPKFVCVDCRRCFKQTTLEGNDYQKSDYGEIHLVRPDCERIPQVWKTYASTMARGSTSQESAQQIRQKETFYMQNLFKELYAGMECEKYSFTPEELEQLRQVSPTFHWKDMRGNAHCPGCGKEGRPVGGTFRPCAKTDEKGWKQIEKMLEGGEDFSYCMTYAEQLEVIQEGRRLREKKKGEESWAIEKERRIAELQEASKVSRHTGIDL